MGVAPLDHVELTSGYFSPSSHNKRLLRDAFARFATGVTVVTTKTDKGVVAITANSFCSVSLDPALILWCLDQNSSRYHFFRDAREFSVHILSSEQIDLCWNVAKEANYFLDSPLEPTDLMVEKLDELSGEIACFDCVFHDSHEAGDHTIIIGNVMRAYVAPSAEPLVFFDGKIQEGRAETGSI